MLEPEAEELEIEMTPMIDVTFLLLIFFMVTMTLAQPTDVKLPRSESGRAETVDGKLLIHLRVGDDEAQCFRSGTDEETTVSMNELESLVKRNLNAEGALIRADEDLPFTFIDTVASKIKSAGIKSVRLGVKDRSEMR